MSNRVPGDDYALVFRNLEWDRDVTFTEHALQVDGERQIQDALRRASPAFRKWILQAAKQIVDVGAERN